MLNKNTQTKYNISVFVRGYVPVLRKFNRFFSYWLVFYPVFHLSIRSDFVGSIRSIKVTPEKKCGLQKLITRFCRNDKEREREGGRKGRNVVSVEADAGVNRAIQRGGKGRQGWWRTDAGSRRRDTDASSSGAKAKTAEWNYSCSIVYNGRINGLNRRCSDRSLFVIAQRGAASKSRVLTRQKSRGKSQRQSGKQRCRDNDTRGYLLLTVKNVNGDTQYPRLCSFASKFAVFTLFH